MSFSHGRKAEVAVSQYDVTQFFKGATLSVDVDTAETSTFRNTWKSYVPGQAGAKVDLEGFYDTVMEPVIQNLKLTALPFLATVGPAGLKNGDRARMLYVDTSNITESSPIGDAVLLNWSLISEAEAFFGYSLRDVTIPATVTGTGNAVDTGTAVTPASWAAHFHLLSLSGTGGPTVTLKVQDSADGATGWADIASVTSGALNAVGALRVTGTGNVRRYIRGSWTITGTGPSANFALAFGRHA
jgi:hypothetical protein